MVTTFRGWEYAKHGDYHRNIDPNWSYAPTYYKKVKEVDGFIESLSINARILDAGCGEGVLVEKYQKLGKNITGIDLNYESEYVKLGNILNMPYADNSFDTVLLLDVFEHLSFADQPNALKEIIRVLKPRGLLFTTIPNLAHINSRFKFFFGSLFDRTDIETNHPGERPFKENMNILQTAGFKILKIKGITLTLPFVYRGIICRKPSAFRWLHDLLNVFARPSMAMLNIFLCEKG